MRMVFRIYKMVFIKYRYKDLRINVVNRICKSTLMNIYRTYAAI